MPFSWMVSFLVNTGKQFRRKSWGQGNWIGFFSNQLQIFNGNSWEDYTFTNEDILATDWEVK